MGNGLEGVEQKIGISVMLFLFSFPLDSVSSPFYQFELPKKPNFSIF